MTAELRERVLRLLRELEWKGRDPDGASGQCILDCGEYREVRKHVADCELAAVIRELEEK